MLGPGPAAPGSAPDIEDDGEAVTRVGKLPPEFARQPQAAVLPAAPPARISPQAVQQVPVAPRKAARRRTLSRGETSPLAQGRRPTQDGRDSRGSQSGAEARPAQAPNDGRRARDAAPRGGPLPSEVPTAPGSDARAGAAASARAAALKALALADEEVTAQRDVAVLQRLKDLKELKDLVVDDLDEDTSVLPGLKIKEAAAAAVAAKRAAEEEATRRADREIARHQQTAETRPVPAAYAASQHGHDDDRPTPTDDLSSTASPDTSRTSVAGIENALSGDTGRYSAVDALWVATDGRGRSLTVQNPAAAVEAAAADAAVAAAAAKASAAAAAASAAAQQAPTQITGPAAPVCAFRVAVLRPDSAGGLARVVALPAGAALPPGATGAMLVATSEAESAELARIFGYTG